MGALHVSEDQAAQLIDWNAFSASRASMGAGFVRMLSYFREDGETAVARIECAMQGGDAAALVAPADRLKEDAQAFGADMLADLAEEIEVTARRAIENRLFPSDLIPEVAKLRPLYATTVEQLERAATPLQPRRAAAR